MSAAEPVAVLHVSVAWWLRFYLVGVVIAAGLTGTRPRADRVARMMQRALRVRAG